MHRCQFLGKHRQQQGQGTESCICGVSCSSGIATNNCIGECLTEIWDEKYPTESRHICLVRRLKSTQNWCQLDELGSSNFGSISSMKSACGACGSIRWHCATSGVHCIIRPLSTIEIILSMCSKPYSPLATSTTTSKQMMDQSILMELFNEYNNHISYYILKSAGLYVSGQFKPTCCRYSTILSLCPW